MLKLLVFILIIASSVSLKAATIEAFVSILPQQYFVQRIGGDRVNVNVMVKPGQSPETFEPSPKLMALYSKADVYFTIEMPFEQVWIDRVASLNQRVSVVNTQPHSDSQSPLLPDQHSHDKFDPHTWLSPVLAIAQAKVIVHELSRLSPEDKELFFNNYKELEKELNALDDELSRLFEARSGLNFVTFHPAFSYFAQQYGLTQLAIEVEGKEPSAKQIAQIVNRIRDKNVAYILIERQFNQMIPKTIAHSVGAKLLVLDPLALDYLSNMRDIAAKINKALF